LFFNYKRRQGEKISDQNGMALCLLLLLSILKIFLTNKKEVAMSLIKRNKNLLPSFSRIWDDDDFFNRNLMNWGVSNFSDAGSTLPAVNIRETEDSYQVEMAAPGMKKEDFKIELDNNMLTISSEKSEEYEENEKEKYSRREFSYQSFQRSFSLPKEVVDEEKIQARYKDGMLYLTIPKKEEAKQKPPRKIQIA
jgi:HSP20 family protein